MISPEPEPLFSGDWHIRPARKEDLPVLTGLLGELFSLEPDYPVREEAQRRGLELLLGDSRSLVLTAVHRDSGGPAGMAVMQILLSTAEGGPAGLVEDLVVAPAFRGLGAGRLLLSVLESAAAGQGISRLQLLVDRENRSALEFYSRNGWEETRMRALRRRI